LIHVSIRENLHFNQKFDCIEGFEDLGMQHCKSCSGFHGLWPALKVEATSGLLLWPWKHKGRDDCAVLDICQNAELQVVATVCGMGANSVKALELLGATKRKPSFSTLS
jgi:hypothetical protein